MAEEDDIFNLDPADKYEHQKRLAKIRQQTYYDSKKAIILQKKRADRRELKRLRLEVVALQQQIPEAPRRRRGAVPEERPNAFSAREIEEKKKVAKKTLFTPELVKAQLTALIGTENITTHEATRKTTIESHISNMATVFRATNCPDLKGCLKKFKEIKADIDKAKQIKKGKTEETYALNSRKNFYQSILYVIHNLYIPIPPETVRKYETEYDQLNIESGIQQKEREASQEHAVVPYDEVLKKVEEVYPADSKQVLVANMYNDVMARDNYGNLKILSTNKDDDTLKAGKKDEMNYLVVGRGDARVKVILTQYKTNSKYGIIRQEFSKKTSALIRAYMERYGIKPNDTLFGGKLTGMIGNMLRKVGITEGKGAVNYIRHSKKTQIFRDNPNMNTEELDKVAKAFAHSPVTSLAYLRQIKAI